MAGGVLAIFVVAALLLLRDGDDQAPSEGELTTITDAEKVYGFNEDPDPSFFPLQASVGMPVRRLPVPWIAVEPAPGQWDWTAADAQYSALLEQGLRPLVLALAAPCWAYPSLPCSPTTQAPPDAEFDSAWTEYMHQLAGRYPEAVGIEIWNEPNLTVTFQPEADPERYATLLALAYEAVKRVDPQMPVVSAGLFPSAESGADGIADSEFLAGVFAAGGGEAMDAIGAHPYPVVDPGGAPSLNLDSVEEALGRVRSARDAAGEQSKPIWITEIGVSTQGAPEAPGEIEEQQADDLLAMLGLFEDDSDVRMVLIHRLIDDPYNPVTEGSGELVESGFGVFRSDGTPKPSACALSSEFHGSLAC